ncbi:MAG: SpoIID/LytB domain-containing protein [Caloramator sp.]|nr:SpoIID/LytB domain-containing protein [Caloramator sp.]
MKKRIISFILTIIMVMSMFNGVFAAVDRSPYYEDIRVGLSSMIKENVSIKLNGVYLLDGQTVENTEFILKIRENKIDLNGNLMDSITLEPQNKDNLVTITLLDANLQPLKDSYGNVIKRSYFGKFIFKAKDAKVFAINILDIERYVLGVIPYEMGDAFNIEALKAQAIASRSYGLYYHINAKIGSEYDLIDSTSNQVYRGYSSSSLKCKQAVEETKGQVLIYYDTIKDKEYIIPAYFHSSNGGYTEASQNVWLQSFPYFISRVDEYSVTDWPSITVDGVKTTKRTFTVQKIDELLKKAGYVPADGSFLRLDIENIERFESGRVKKINIVYKDLAGNEITVGLEKQRFKDALSLPSNMYAVEFNEADNTYIFSGKGYGHGIGLSQWGAEYRARAGQNYIDILNFYYPGTQLYSLTSYINRLSLSRPVVFVNDNVVVDVAAEEGAVFRYEVIRDGKIVYVDDEKSDRQFTYKPNVAGDYIVRVSAKPISANGYSDTKEIGFKATLPQVSRGGEQVAVNTFRIYGNDRIKTAVAVSQTGWDESEYAIIARADEFPDALSAGPLAKKYDAPILLTNKNSLNQDVELELLRLGVKNVFIIGSEGAVSKAVEDKIKSININVERIGGDDRYETAIKIAEKLGTSSEVFIATGLNYPDALSVSSVAAIKGAPIILTPKNKQNEKVKQYLENLNLDKIYVIGGEEVIPNSVLQGFNDKIERVSGKDRYLTNIEIAKKFNDIISHNKVYVATGTNFPDALAGSSLAAKNNGMIILASDKVKDETKNYLNIKYTNYTVKFVLGGKDVVKIDSIKSMFSY